MKNIWLAFGRGDRFEQHQSSCRIAALVLRQRQVVLDRFRIRPQREGALEHASRARVVFAVGQPQAGGRESVEICGTVGGGAIQLRRFCSVALLLVDRSKLQLRRGKRWQYIDRFAERSGGFIDLALFAVNDPECVVQDGRARVLLDAREEPLFGVRQARPVQ